MHQPQEQKIDGTFLQYVFDNADHNINTIDGRNTFHAMGGIEIATPLNLVKSNECIAKLKNIPSSHFIGQFGAVDIKCFKKRPHSGWENVTISNLNILHPIKINPTISATDVLWIFGRKIHPEYFIGWNGFMEKRTSHLNYERSKVIFLPFVNAILSNYDTIYTVLLEADARRQAAGQNRTFVTFDQPLYYKAREILECCEE